MGKYIDLKNYDARQSLEQSEDYREGRLEDHDLPKKIGKGKTGRKTSRKQKMLDKALRASRKARGK